MFTTRNQNGVQSLNFRLITDPTTKAKQLLMLIWRTRRLGHESVVVSSSPCTRWEIFNFHSFLQFEKSEGKKARVLIFKNGKKKSRISIISKAKRVIVITIL